MGDFAAQLKELRRSRKMTQGALATQLGFSQQAVAKWENQQSIPDPQTLKRITEIFEVSIDWLLGFHAESQSMEELPILREIHTDYDAEQIQGECGYEMAHGWDRKSHFYLLVTDDSMIPYIYPGDLALVQAQQKVESGELAVVSIDGKEGRLKKVIKRDGGIILQSFNPQCDLQFFSDQQRDLFRIFGRVLETKRRW